MYGLTKMRGLIWLSLRRFLSVPLSIKVRRISAYAFREKVLFGDNFKKIKTKTKIKIKTKYNNEGGKGRIVDIRSKI